jgi:hypothetical protein
MTGGRSACANPEVPCRTEKSVTGHCLREAFRRGEFATVLGVAMNGRSRERVSVERVPLSTARYPRHDACDKGRPMLRARLHPVGLLRPAIALGAAAVFAMPASARADDSQVPVVVRSHGRPWSLRSTDRGSSVPKVDGSGSEEEIHVPRGRYVLWMDGTRSTVDVEDPATIIEYHHENTALRKIGAVGFFGGLAVDGAVVGLYLLGQRSREPNQVPYPETVADRERAQQISLGMAIAFGAGLALTVVGGTLYFMSGSHVTVDSSAPRPSQPRLDLGVASVPSGVGLNLALTL